jgi:CelD/BcsL family acetyltransferase involved in cellulose biosynthesis
MTYAGRYLTLKPGYDEAYAPYSPGQLLTEDSIRDAINRGVVEFDLLGDELPCKLDWTEQVRPHSWLFVFRNSGRGRLLRTTKFNLMPTAREVVARLRG